MTVSVTLYVLYVLCMWCGVQGSGIMGYIISAVSNTPPSSPPPPMKSRAVSSSQVQPPPRLPPYSDRDNVRGPATSAPPPPHPHTGASRRYMNASVLTYLTCRRGLQRSQPQRPRGQPARQSIQLGRGAGRMSNHLIRAVRYSIHLRVGFV